MAVAIVVEAKMLTHSWYGRLLVKIRERCSYAYFAGNPMDFTPPRQT
jgi:hypothetical protein